MFNFLRKRDNDVILETSNEKMESALISMLQGIEEKVTEDVALEIPAVSQCVELISSLIAGIPIKLFVNTENGISEVLEDKRLDMLNIEVGNNITAYEFKKSIVKDYLLLGNAYAYIERRKGNFDNLYYIKPKDIIPYGNNNNKIKKDRALMVYGARYYTHNFFKLVKDSEDGISGRGLIDNLETYLLANYINIKLEKFISANGGLKRGIIGAEKPLTRGALEKLREQFKSLFKNPESANILYLNAGINYKDLTSTPQELQLVENKENNTKQIYRYFHVPITIFDGGARTDYDKDYFVAFALMPIIQAFESALNKDLLLEKEKKKYFFAFDLREIAKGSTVERYKAYTEAVRGRWLMPSEVRELENREPIEGLDVILYNLSDVLYNSANNTYFTPNTKDITDSKATSKDKIENVERKGKIAKVEK